ncbi:MAG: 16S rRNA (guanine(527)-N(7))-methyltransferase RsmG [Methylophilaceae bacterium]
MSVLATKLAAGIAESHIDIDLQAQEKMLNYLSLLQKWNKVYNLTAVRDPLDMVTLHILDSLSVLPRIRCKRILDVGAGAGLPGIVLAICLPDLQVTTIDTVQKKAIFMRQVKGELGLSNLTVVHDRVENYSPQEKFDVIISRAFSEIGLFVKLTKHLLKDDGKWFAMKGVIPVHEFESSDLLPSEIIALNVPGLEAERHLVVIEKSGKNREN